MSGWNPFARPSSDEERSMDSLAPNDAETARVRDLLSRLATEPLPPPAASRLAERLERELPTPAPRRRLLANGYRRAALSAIVPVAIGVAIAVAVFGQDRGGVRENGAFGPLSTAPALADEDAAGSSSSAAASSSSAAAATSAAAPATSVAASSPNAAPAASGLQSAMVAPDGTLKAASGAAGAPARVPSVVDRYPADAVTALRSRGFRVRFAPVPPMSEADLGINGYLVDRQQPAAGKDAPRGTVVTLRVVVNDNAGGLQTSSPNAVTVPNVVGLDANAALHRLVQAGLLVTIRGSTVPLSSLAIAAQDVQAGSTVRSRTVITLSFGT
jgi:PASTA domain